MSSTKNYDLDIDTTLGGNNASDYIIPSQKAIKTYVDNNAGGLPSQSGNSGKLLTTDGADPSWSAIKTVANTSLLGSGNIDAVTTSDLVEVPCVTEEYVTSGVRVRIWSTGLIEQWRTSLSNSTAGVKSVTYPVAFTSTPALFVNYYLADTASTSITVRNMGYSRSSTGFSAYMAANSYLSYYAVGY